MGIIRTTTEWPDPTAWQAESDFDAALWWLGQAGFAVRWSGGFVLIDPYLSDYLAVKHAGTEFEHRRMMAPTARAEDFRKLDAVLCTHSHGDHMDPGTLPVLAANNPKCRFIVPAAETDSALSAGVPEDRLVAVDAGQTVRIADGSSVAAIASAHEDLKRDAQGRCHNLGYVIDTGGLRIYHSGDCVPWDGLTRSLRKLRPHIALLPVNGRDKYRTSKGIIGNFNVAEAVSVCRDSGIPALIPHHFGMFEFNTVDVGELTDYLDREAGDLEWAVPRPGVAFAASEGL